MVNRENDTDSRILVVDTTTREEIVHIEKCLIDWKYEVIPLNGEETGIVAPIPKSPSLMLVYAQEEQKDTVAICEQLRRRMKNITSIITSFDQENIRVRIDEILGTT